MSAEPMSMGALIEKWLDTLPTEELYALATTCRDMAEQADAARARRIPDGDR